MCEEEMMSRILAKIGKDVLGVSIDPNEMRNDTERLECSVAAIGVAMHAAFLAAQAVGRDSFEGQMAILLRRINDRHDHRQQVGKFLYDRRMEKAMTTKHIRETVPGQVEENGDTWAPTQDYSEHVALMGYQAARKGAQNSYAPGVNHDLWEKGAAAYRAGIKLFA
jgi:hypothetical protein